MVTEFETHDDEVLRHYYNLEREYFTDERHLTDVGILLDEIDYLRNTLNQIDALVTSTVER